MFLVFKFLVVSFFACFLSNNNFDMRETAENCLANFGTVFDIEEAVKNVYDLSDDNEAKFRLGRVYVNLPIAEYPTLDTAVFFRQQVLCLENGLDAEKKFWLEKAEGDPVLASKLLIEATRVDAAEKTKKSQEESPYYVYNAEEVLNELLTKDKEDIRATRENQLKKEKK